jgi:hypothetical protein
MLKSSSGWSAKVSKARCCLAHCTGPDEDGQAQAQTLEAIYIMPRKARPRLFQNIGLFGRMPWHDVTLTRELALANMPASCSRVHRAVSVHEIIADLHRLCAKKQGFAATPACFR